MSVKLPIHLHRPDVSHFSIKYLSAIDSLCQSAEDENVYGNGRHNGFVFSLHSLTIVFLLVSLISSSVSASDCDSGENADLTYYTLSPDFTISPHGTIFPAGPLDYERLNHLYEFVVMAVDKGEVPRTGTTTVRIRMANVNDEAPDFSQHM